MFNKIIFVLIFSLFSFSFCFAAVKEPDFAGQFYPAAKEQLSAMIDTFLKAAQPYPVNGKIFMLISPHAGYGYSGPTAAFGYKLIKGQPYKTVIILGTSHHKLFNGAAVYGQGAFKTSLGQVRIDEDFVKKITGKIPEIFLDEPVFKGEHSVEVQLPFLQKVLASFSSTPAGYSRWKIVPLVISDCSLDSCKKIAGVLNETIGQRKDVLVVVSSDMYHGYDLEEEAKTDAYTLGLVSKLDYEKLYYSLRDGTADIDGQGFAAVIGLNLAKLRGYKKAEILSQTNSGIASGNPVNGQWTVGYASCVIADSQEGKMLNTEQKERLLKIARDSINEYLKTGKKLKVSETDPMLSKNLGAFVTLNKHGNLRGCIGNLVGYQPLYLTVRDMAIEAAVGDPRFPELTQDELNGITIEISVLSALEKTDSAEKIELGKHGVLVKKGASSGVFLPQVATETGWSKEEFLNSLCEHKAGLPKDAWKDKETELYIFSAEVFSEKE